MDRFYTPLALAAELVGAVENPEPGVVVDFAAGDGSLLLAATTKWPNAKIVGTDIHRPTVRRLANTYERWTVFRTDFLRARQTRIAARSGFGEFDVVLLNPPFSCRGGSCWTVDLNGNTVSCSRALAFVLRA